MRELADRAEEMQEPNVDGGAEQRKFAVVTLETVKQTYYVYAADEVEAADRWLHDDIDDSIAEPQRVSEQVLQIAEVRA